MKSPRLILCATDLRAGGDRAVVEADAWARRHDASLAFVHAIPDPSRMHVLFPQFAHKAFTELPELSRRLADAVAERVTKLTVRASAELDIRVDVGSPAAVIVAVAEEMGADLVVVGAGGEDTSIGLLGSVALRVVQHAHSPVLLVRPGPERGPVLVASDLSDPGFPAIAAGAFLASAVGEDLTVLHVAELPTVPLPSPDGAGLGLSYGLSASDLLSLREAARDSLVSAMTRLGLKGQCLVEQGIPSVQVVGCARRLGARLLVIGTEGRTGLRRMLLGSTAEQILRDASCPVMVVRLHSQGGHP
ncbi:MAG: universal stress protein [Vicinamibacteria bacterium]|nr:universal stress protein [Vicinamibacteria bacterium]